MVFKKPYAILIKNFKLIHLILTIIYTYLAFRVSGILNYYNNFISGKIGKLAAINYVGSFYVVAIILSILICIVIYILLKHKNKPRILYILLISIYIVVFLIVSTSITGLRTIYFSSPDSKSIRLYRDLLRIILLFQYITIAFTLIRGLGFDIKKFDFSKDLNELNIDVSDSEEVELTLGSTKNIERKTRRKLREFTYYYKENKIFLEIIAVVIIIVLLSTFTIDKKVINKTYSENQIFKTDTFNLNVQNSYITSKNKSNQTLSNTGSFVIINLQISPNNGASSINPSNLILSTKKNTYKSKTNYTNNFKDLGNNYSGQKISTTKNYLFIFEISNEEQNSNMQLIYSGDIKINLSPVNLDKISTTKKLKKGEQIDLSDTVLKYGNITINSYEINNKFKYQYKYEINNEEHTSNLNISSTNNTIIKLNMNYTLPNNLSLNDFISTYATLKYEINNEEKASKLLTNKTPGTYNEGIYLEIDKEIEAANKIYFEFTIRNKKYIYEIK